MSRTFAYARVSTVEQLTENQKEQIAAAGYKIEARRFVEEKTQAQSRHSNARGSGSCWKG